MSDIAVTMGPQGVSEVVAALHKIQQESNKTARAGTDAAGGVSKISNAVSSLKSAAHALGGLYLANQFKELVASAIDTADAIGDLAAATGASAKDISVIGVAAREAGTDFGVIEKAMKAFAVAQEQAKGGNAEAAKAFKVLGINAKDLAGMNMGQIFGRVAEGLSRVGGSSEKVKIAQELFGKTGMEMLDVCDRVGAEGFEKLGQRAEKAGLLVSDQTAAAAGNLKQSMGQMKLLAEGLAMQFVEGLAPAVASGMSAISGTMQDGKTVFQRFGEFCGGVFKAVIAGIMTIAAAAAKVWAVIASAPGYAQGLGNRIAGTARAARAGLLKVGSWLTPDSWGLGDAARAEMDKAQEDWDVMHSQWSDAYKDMTNKFETIGANYRDFMDKLKYGDQSAAGAPSISGNKDVDLSGGNGKSSAEAQRAAKVLAEAQAAFLKARIEAENKLIEANNARQLQFLKDQYDFDMSETAKTYDEKMAIVKNYYAGVRRIAQENGENELMALQVQIDELQAKKTDNPADELKRQAELQKLNAEFQARSLALEQNQSATYKDELKALRDINRERNEQYRQVGEAQFDLAKRTAELQGETIAVQRMGLEEELAGLWEKLRLSEEIGSEQWQSAKATYDAFKTAREAEIAYQEQKLAYEREFNRFESAKQKIQIDVDAGRLSEKQGDYALLQLEQSRLPVLQQIVALLQAAAAATGNQTLKDEANKIDTQIQTYQASLDAAASSFDVFKSKAIDAIEGQLAAFFSSGINNAKSFADAMRSMALGVVQALQQIVAQMLINLMFQRLMGGIFAAIGGGGGAPFGGTKMVRMASGGIVSGPGTGTSDSIPAMLSAGEYVVPAAVVRQPGVLPALEDLRAGLNLSLVQPSFRRHRFAEGGLVSPGAGGSSSGDNSSLTVALEDGLVLRSLQTPAGKRVLVKALADKKRAVRGVLG